VKGSNYANNLSLKVQAAASFMKRVSSTVGGFISVCTLWPQAKRTNRTPL